MIPPNRRSKVVSGSREAVMAPSSAPAATGSSTRVACGMPEMPWARNPQTATPFWIRTPTRLVPLARVPGRPMSTSSGTVRSEPPPARVFTMPATNPPPASRSASPISTGAVQ